MIALTTFATGHFTVSQLARSQSALAWGASQVTLWGREQLEATDFYRERRGILDLPRGAGYWLWKPFIILHGLERLSPGDVLIYCDCGNPGKPHTIERPLKIIADWTCEEAGGMLPGVYLPDHGPARWWTKGECFRAMGCRDRSIHDHPQIQASFSVWRRQPESIDFVREWLRWCTDPAAVLDEKVDPSIPDDPGFIEHRHDQSILTILALQRGLRCFGSPWETRGRTRDINVLIDRISGRLQPRVVEHWGPTEAVA
jgi:hypothetical protein